MRGAVSTLGTVGRWSALIVLMLVAAAARGGTLVEAGAARLGVWRDGFYAVRSADEAGRYLDSFQLVEGTVAEASKVKGQVFLNLGPDWHSAFTLRLARPALALFKADGFDPLALKGARL